MDNGLPTLTLEPDKKTEDVFAMPQAPAATVVTDQPKTGDAPTLTLGNETTEKADAQRDANAVTIDENMLSDEEKQIVKEFSEKIDLSDSNMIMTYGSAVQLYNDAGISLMLRSR